MTGKKRATDMTSVEEQYVHLAQCADDLNEAWIILQDIGRVPSAPLVGAAFKYALIAYSRPYKLSHGEIQQKHKLNISFVPLEHRELHNRILAARDGVLAHSDLTVRQAKVHVEATPSGKFVGVVQRVVRGTEELANLRAVIDLIEKTLDHMYKRVREIEQLIPARTRQH